MMTTRNQKQGRTFLVAVLAAVGGWFGYRHWQEREQEKKRRGTPPLLPDEPPDEPFFDEPPPAGPITPVGSPSYVGYARAKGGGPDYDWPHRDTFPDEASFAIFLADLGYDILDPDPISESMMRRVKTFQRDSNEVRRSWLEAEGKPITGLLDEDGLIGDHTIPRLIYARQRQVVEGRSWLHIVRDAYAELGLDYPGMAEI